jgi:multimeric flavodoxin WrbA
MSKTFRLANIVKDVLAQASIDVDFLDLSLLTSEYGRKIHPCKACVSTAMPLCHWPCSCYPNHSLAQTNDWMNEIYPRWVGAHAIVIVTPTHWYQTSSALKLMIDRLVCADGGNPDPTSTHGKKPEEAKALELKGWDYPKHLRVAVYGLVVHGDVAGIEGSRRALSDWLDWMGLVDAGAQARLDRFIGYYEPLRDQPRGTRPRRGGPGRDAQRRSRGGAVTAALRAGSLDAALPALKRPRPK